MRKLRIALANIYSEPFGIKNTGGLITSSTKLASEDEQFIPVTFGKPKKSHAEGWSYFESIEGLNDFDFVIFSSFGTISKHKPLLNAVSELWMLDVPFAVQSHSELDERNKKFDHDLFTNHSKFRFWMPITKNLYGVDPVQSELKYPFLAHESSIKNVSTSVKKNVVASTSRLTTTKRIFELASLSEDLRGIGYETRSYGDTSGAFFYKRAIDDIDHCLKWCDGFTQDQLIRVLSEVKYHWNCRFYKVGRQMDRRLELASIEALQNGCIPIVHSLSTPLEYSELCVFRDIRSELNSVVSDIKEGKGDVAQMIEVFNDVHAGKNEKLIRYIRGIL